MVWTILPWLIAGAVTYFIYTSNQRPDVEKPDNSAKPTERADAAIAVPSKADRALVSEALVAVALLLEADGADGKPAIKLREQVSEQILAETARSLVLSGVVIADKQAFATLASSYFDSDDEFPTKAGPLSTEDRAKGVKQIKALANAFR